MYAKVTRTVPAFKKSSSSDDACVDAYVRVSMQLVWSHTKLLLIEYSYEAPLYQLPVPATQYSKNIIASVVVTMHVIEHCISIERIVHSVCDIAKSAQETN